MTQRYTCKMTLTVLGPFLTAATGPDRYGVDKSAHRDHTGRLVIPASHLKGKLRSALGELELFFEDANRPDLDALFGGASAEGSYEPRPAALRFGDLICENLPHESTRTRVTINRVSQTAQQNLLREVDDPFASGSEVSFTGEVSFSAADMATANRVASVLRSGLRWLATVGSEKGVGFGRLKSARVDALKPVSVVAKPVASLGASGALHLRITAQEPLLAGGIKSRRTNYVVSRQELSGGLLKGALSAALNEAHGVLPVTRPLDASCAADFPGFETLVTRFSAIRVTHAWPARAGNPRPVRLPLSTAEHNGKLAGDVALSKENPPLIHEGQKTYSPAYFGDAKALEPYEGLAKPVELFVTRSEIDDVSQRTAEGQLFTYHFFAPYTLDGAIEYPIEWVCNVDFTAITDETERAAACQQFAAAVEQYLRRLGKLARAVGVAVHAGRAASAVSGTTQARDGLFLITLQSDAIMLDPEVVRKLPLGTNLQEAYAAYWAGLTGGSLLLEDFFAHQGFEGGYRYHRYLGAAERTAQPNRYRPYYLTLAGSVFRLRVMNEQKAFDFVTDFLSRGLPLPPWALEEYTRHGRAPWENCPFVRENGYGEIVVNLDWHWDYPFDSGPYELCEVKNDESAQG